MQRIFKVSKSGLQCLLNNGIIHRNNVYQLLEGPQNAVGLLAGNLIAVVVCCKLPQAPDRHSKQPVAKGYG